MITVETHEVESRLASLLAEVQERQETILIFQDGEPVAELRPPTANRDPLRLHPELSQITFFEDPVKPLDPEDWPDSGLPE